MATWGHASQTGRRAGLHLEVLLCQDPLSADCVRHSLSRGDLNEPLHDSGGFLSAVDRRRPIRSCPSRGTLTRRHLSTRIDPPFLGRPIQANAPHLEEGGGVWMVEVVASD